MSTIQNRWYQMQGCPTRVLLLGGYILSQCLIQYLTNNAIFVIAKRYFNNLVLKCERFLLITYHAIAITLM